MNITSTETPQTPIAEEAGNMSLMDHVREIRDRLFKCVIAVVIACAISFIFAERVMQILVQPYGGTIIATTPWEGLTNAFTVAMTMAVTLTLPFLLYQFLAFIMPGLYESEKRWIYIGLPFGFLLFLIGAAFAWLVLLPSSIKFLTGIFPTVITFTLRAEEYLPFVTGIIFWMGVAFEMPLIIFILAKTNVVSGRILAARWRYAVVIIAIIAMFITPTPDPLNMGLVMVPLLILYGISIVLALLARRGKTIPAVLDPDEK
jgi:sec-independent protein translocase protein TatC